LSLVRKTLQEREFSGYCIRTHDIRRLFITELIYEKEWTFVEVGAYVGHSNQYITEVYFQRGEVDLTHLVRGESTAGRQRNPRVDR
jgi:integrase